MGVGPAVAKFSRGSSGIHRQSPGMPHIEKNDDLGLADAG
ncbi:hypothetical protein SAMN05444161_1977 [Rhizobiales bacterium GAS191]|nr:hypothetical protein SAMN05519103_01088 [Rhizobiales bacterium GAS113]SEC41824.1 hypothetical protein SAMN05519104_1344 [Rhizobiales bacterium GAS188]SEC85593.1 hypothetical protein SAMN05444161_1977 [Rhizobiales bacterium GAS191]